MASQEENLRRLTKMFEEADRELTERALELEARGGDSLRRPTPARARRGAGDTSAAKGERKGSGSETDKRRL